MSAEGAARAAQDVAARLVDGASLAYVSDYLSFAGADDVGRVGFALDTNRGRDGRDQQAEHLYAVLHDEHAGFVDVVGTGRYPPSGTLLDLPDSPAFSFAGDPWRGLALRSERNVLALDVQPLVERLRRTDASTLYVMTSAPAVLTWRGRRLAGRVVHEHLTRRDADLMTRRSFSGLGDMQYLYLRTASGDDLYVQRYDSSRPMAGMEPLLGFRTRGEATTQLRDLSFRATGHAVAPGLYRWSTDWQIRFTDDEGPAELVVRTLRRHRVSTWVVAGLAMAAVVGTVRRAGVPDTEVHGFGELFATAPSVVWDRVAPG